MIGKEISAVMRRWVLVMLAFVAGFGLLTQGVAAAESRAIRMVDVVVRTIEADRFVRLSEYFTGKENQGRRVFLRTDPESRGGLYFIVRLSCNVSDLPVGSRLEVDLIDGAEAMQSFHRFQIPNPVRRTKVLFAGLTHGEEPIRVMPLAWRLRLFGPGDMLLAERMSYLWEMPENGKTDDQEQAVQD